VTLSEEDAHHLRVLRLHPGATLRGIDGEGTAYELLLEAMEKRSARVRVVSAATSTHEPTVRVWIIQASLHTSRMDWLVEKAAELGVFGVAVVRTARSQRAAEPGRLERWRRLATAATLQSLGARTPLVEACADIDHALDLAETENVVLADSSGMPIRSGLMVPCDRAIAAVLGPEGGLADNERAALIARGARPVSLGPRRLRAETAAIVTASAILAACSPPA
jgi:16S rRNA (uracil1498-N3)-methyltransferase